MKRPSLSILVIPTFLLISSTANAQSPFIPPGGYDPWNARGLRFSKEYANSWRRSQLQRYVPQPAPWWQRHRNALDIYRGQITSQRKNPNSIRRPIPIPPPFPPPPLIHRPGLPPGPLLNRNYPRHWR